MKLLRRLQVGRANLAIRRFSYIHDPEYGVQIQDVGDIMPPHEVRVPWFTDAQKDEIYNKHKSDPVKYSTRTLSKMYSALESRIKGIIYLRREREEYMKANSLIDIPIAHENLYKR